MQQGLRSAASKFDHVDSYQGGTQLYVYSKNLETLGMKCKRACCHQIGAIDIAHFLAELTGSGEGKSSLVISVRDEECDGSFTDCLAFF